jgi:hypothetical protein
MKTLFCALTVVAVSGFVATPAQGQIPTGNCYNCYSDGVRLYCALLQPSGGETCRQPNAQTCILVGACGLGGCFLAGTPVETEHGTRAIETLAVGDKVIGAAEGEIHRGTVTHIFRSIELGYYVINGEVRVTGTHPFLTERGWVVASELCVGDRLQGPNGEAVVVESIGNVARAVRAYNITVDGDHTFFAGGLLVHNKPPRYQQ